jgi:hypothetical protein
MKWNEMYLMINIVKLIENICELIYYKVLLMGVKFSTYWSDYKRSVSKVIEPQYIVDDSHKFSNEEEIYTNPIIQKEKGFI